MKYRQTGIIIALILIMFMAAIETSIIALALPTIKNEFNVGSNVSLIFAIYFIAIVLANPIVGELLSRIKVIYLTLIGLVLFTIGSLLAGFSMSFEVLIISRFIQGLGSGILMALSQIVPKMAFAIPKRYKVMGIVGSVWGIASLVGPLLGGFILEISTWHWLFFINVPIAIAAAILVLWTYHFDNEILSSSTIDFKGVSLFYVMVFLLLITVLSKVNLIANGLALILFLIVGYILFKLERRIENPFVPVGEFNGLINRIFITDFLYAIMLMGYNIYMPIYLQEELGLSPLQSGFTILPISLAWIVMTFTMNYFEQRLSYQMMYIVAFFCLTICSFILLIGTYHPVVVFMALFLAGVSFGTVYTKDSVTIQEQSSDQHMKRMMSLYTLTKSLGNAVGSSIMGVIYALPIIWSLHIHNVLFTVLIILALLFTLWISTRRFSLK